MNSVAMPSHPPLLASLLLALVVGGSNTTFGQRSRPLVGHMLKTTLSTQNVFLHLAFQED